MILNYWQSSYSTLQPRFSRNVDIAVHRTRALKKKKAIDCSLTLCVSKCHSYIICLAVHAMHVYCIRHVLLCPILNTLLSACCCYRQGNEIFNQMVFMCVDYCWPYLWLCHWKTNSNIPPKISFYEYLQKVWILRSLGSFWYHDKWQFWESIMTLWDILDHI